MMLTRSRQFESPDAWYVAPDESRRTAASPARSDANGIIDAPDTTPIEHVVAVAVARFRINASPTDVSDAVLMLVGVADRT